MSRPGLRREPRLRLGQIVPHDPQPLVNQRLPQGVKLGCARHEDAHLCVDRDDALMLAVVGEVRCGVAAGADDVRHQLNDVRTAAGAVGRLANSKTTNTATAHSAKISNQLLNRRQSLKPRQ